MQVVPVSSNCDVCEEDAPRAKDSLSCPPSAVGRDTHPPSGLSMAPRLMGNFTSLKKMTNRANGAVRLSIV